MRKLIPVIQRMAPAVLIAAAATVPAATAETDAEVYILNGGTAAGKLLSMDPGGTLSLLQDQERRTIRLDDVHLIRFAAGQPAGELGLPAGGSGESGGRAAAGVLLARGDYLAGALAGGDTENVIWSHTLLGRLVLPIDALRVFLPGNPEIPAGFARYGRATGEDIVYRAREETAGGDFISGTVDAFSADGLSFDCSLGLVKFTSEQLEAVVIGGSDLSPPPQTSGGPAAKENAEVVVLLRGGTGRLSGSFDSYAGDSLRLTCRSGLEAAIPAAAIDCITFLRASVAYISDLEPSAVVEIPYLGSPDDFLYPFRRDRSVTNQELSCGGKRFAKGLGVHARCAVTYDLGGAFTAFLASAGVSDEVLALKAKGSMIFRVLVDDRVAFESPILRGGGGLVALPVIDLAGAQRITLEADFADGFDSGDRGVWAQALLVR